MNHSTLRLLKPSQEVYVISANFGPTGLFLSLSFSFASKATVERTSIIRDYY